MTIHWYPANPDAGTLGMHSRIQSLDWVTDDWSASGVGEVYGAPRPFAFKPEIPTALGQHVCGTESDFRGQSLRNDTLPPVLYDENGLPLCCGGPAAPRLGVVVGFEPELIDPGPVEVLLGLDCPSAPLLSVGVDYYVQDQFPGVNIWGKYTITPGQQYAFRVLGGNFPAGAAGSTGPDCAGLDTGVFAGLPPGACASWTANATANMLAFVIGGFGSGTPTFFRLDTGAC